MATAGQNSGTLTLRVKDSDIDTVQMIAAQCSLQSLASEGHFARAFKMATGIRLLKSSITKEMMSDLMDLQGSSLGFRTDKDRNGGYEEKIVKECAIEAALRGAYWVGNEFNIIAERAYLTKEFFSRAVREYPGLTDLKLFPGVPKIVDGGALVQYSATWKLNGVACRIDRTQTKLSDGTIIDERIPVKVNSGMGSDAILGKAERKILAAIYKQVTGSDVTDGEAEDSAGMMQSSRQALTLNEIAGKETIDAELAAKAAAKKSPKQSGLSGVKELMLATDDSGTIDKIANDIRKSRELSDDDLNLLQELEDSHKERCRSGAKGDAHEG